MKLDLSQYFDRIGYSGSLDPTIETMCALQRHQTLSVPFENLDVYLQYPVDQNIERIFNKIVLNKRGGWCYELNGLLGWALETLGFNVTRLCGGVARDIRGDTTMGNHLALGVQLDDFWIADAGLGGGILEPYRFEEGPFKQDHGQYRLEQLDNIYWRFHNRDGVEPPSMDFRYEAANEVKLEAQCTEMQSDPSSNFRQNLVCILLNDDGLLSLLGRVLRDPKQGARKRLLKSEEELRDILVTRFKITPPNIDGLWGKVCHRHDALFGDKILGASG